MTQITRNHWIELIIRSVIFLLTVSAYIVEKITRNPTFQYVIYGIIVLFFSYKMIARLIPNKKESMGNQKVFAKNYTLIDDFKKGIKGITKEGNRTALIVAIVWLLGNCSIFILYFSDVIDKGMLMVVAMAFAVCDLICILGICPFQRVFMMNKCCNTCRIYNWDFAMMFTPLWVAPSIVNYILVFQSLVVFIKKTKEYPHFKL